MVKKMSLYSSTLIVTNKAHEINYVCLTCLVLAFYVLAHSKFCLETINNKIRLIVINFI